MLSKWLPYLAGLAVFLLLALLTYALANAPASSAPTSSTDNVDPAQMATLEDKWGIRIANVAMTGNSGLIDFRFQVTDPDKALGILEDENYPVLVDEATGVTMVRPTNHGGHSGDYNAGRTYFFIYQNVNGLVKSGSRITIQVGEVTLEHVFVR